MSRPTCDKILSLPLLNRNLSETIREKLDFEDFNDSGSALSNKKRLLTTIKVPKDLVLISDRLPRPQYHLENERLASKVGKMLKRNNSVPEEIDRLPEI